MTAPRAGYCTQEDLAASIPDDLLAELTAASGTTPDAGVIGQMIADVADEIDGYLACVGVLTPVTTGRLLALLRPRSIIITRYRFVGRRDILTGLRIEDPSKIERDSAIEWLQNIAKKTYGLPADTVMVSSSSGDLAVSGIASSADEPPFCWDDERRTM
jgi:phage gp36-like protein